MSLKDFASWAHAYAPEATCGAADKPAACGAAAELIPA